MTVQVGLALVLLICSGLILRTFRALSRTDPGFARPAELQTFRIATPPIDVPDPAGVTRRQQGIQEKLAAIPGVSAAAFASSVPLEEDSRLDTE